MLFRMYVALLFKVDVAVDGSQRSEAMTVLLIAAHVLLIISVAV